MSVIDTIWQNDPDVARILASEARRQRDGLEHHGDGLLIRARGAEVVLHQRGPHRGEDRGTDRPHKRVGRPGEREERHPGRPVFVLLMEVEDQRQQQPPRALRWGMLPRLLRPSRRPQKPSRSGAFLRLAPIRPSR